MRALALPVDRYPFYDKLLLCAYVLFAPLVLGSLPANFDDGDVSWHIATGRWILGHGELPRTDPFSFTAAGQLWVPHEWLADMGFALAFDAAGYSGLAVLVTLSLIALHLILFMQLRRIVGPAAILLTLIAVDVVLYPFILARPHVLVWPLLGGWTAILLNAREEGRPPPLATALLMVLWTNLHGSFPLGLVIYAAIAVDAALASRFEMSVLRGWLLVGLASALCALLNANGVAGLVYPFATTSMQTLPLIEEWQPSTITKTPWFFAVLLVTFGTLLATGARMTLGALALLLLMLAMAFSQVRHQSWFTIVAALLVPATLATGQRKLAPPLFGGPGGRLAFATFATIVLAAIMAVRLAVSMEPRQSPSNPTALIASVPDSLRSQPVFNGYSLGGPLILAGIRPYIDGRADMYGDSFFSDYNRMVGGDARQFDDAVRKHGITWTILPHTNRGLIRVLDASPEWRRLVTDRVGVIHVRQAVLRADRHLATSSKATKGASHTSRL